MTAFSKLFEHPEYGQILVVARGNEDGAPELIWSVKPPGLGVCDVAIGFDGEDAWEKLDKALAMADEAVARQVIGAVWKTITRQCRLTPELSRAVGVGLNELLCAALHGAMK